MITTVVAPTRRKRHQPPSASRLGWLGAKEVKDGEAPQPLVERDADVDIAREFVMTRLCGVGALLVSGDAVSARQAPWPHWSLVIYTREFLQ
jgi:hypothetical protein